MRGLFITFEGPEGAGKTTHLRLLAEYLQSLGRQTVLTFEPGEGEVGKCIRTLVMHSGLEVLPECEALLYAADRAQHVREFILPAMESGKDVLCDRYVDSSVAYQGAGRGLGREVILEINRFAAGGLEPDLTFFLDVPPQAAFARKGGAQADDRIETAGGEFHATVYAEFQRLARENPVRFRHIDAAQPKEKTAADIRLVIDQYLTDKKENKL